MSRSRFPGSVTRVLASAALGLGFGFGALGVGLVPALGAPIAAHHQVAGAGVTSTGTSSAPVFKPFDATWE
jgi:hypothetical protein